MKKRRKHAWEILKITQTSHTQYELTYGTEQPIQKYDIPKNYTDAKTNESIKLSSCRVFVNDKPFDIYIRRKGGFTNDEKMVIIQFVSKNLCI